MNDYEKTICGEPLSPTPKLAPTVDELKASIDALLAALKSIHGERSECIIMLGIPIPGGHDRFAAGVYGPCLGSRGLLAWGTRQIEAQIDAGDTSRNGKPHP